MATVKKKSIDFEPAYFSKMDNNITQRSGVVWSWIKLIGYCLIAIAFSCHLHYKLPEPISHRGINPKNGLAEFSERNAIETIHYLADTLGYRK